MICADFQGPSLLAGLLGVLQLRWAFQYFRIHRRYSHLTLTEPLPETARLYDETWEAIASGHLREENEVVDLRVGRGWWLGWLLADIAVFAFEKRKTLIFARKADVHFQPRDSVLKSKEGIKGLIKLDLVSANAKLPVDSFEKYVLWKG